MSVSEAARRLGVSRRAVRGRIARGTLTCRVENAGPRVFVPDGAVPRDGTMDASRDRSVVRARDAPGADHGTAPDPDVLTQLREQVAAVNLRAALAEREVLLVREAQAAERERHAQHVADLRSERDRLRAELKEGRKPVLLRVVEALGWAGRSAA